MKIENINRGLCHWRATNGKPPFFLNWEEDGKQQYLFSAVNSSLGATEERLKREQAENESRDKEEVAPAF